MMGIMRIPQSLCLEIVCPCMQPVGLLLLFVVLLLFQIYSKIEQGGRNSSKKLENIFWETAVVVLLLCAQKRASIIIIVDPRRYTPFHRNVSPAVIEIGRQETFDATSSPKYRQPKKISILFRYIIPIFFDNNRYY